MSKISSTPLSESQVQGDIHLPRVEIKFCVQCKWNIRAAYYAQELLQTFSNTIGEIALVPVTGGIFTITLYHLAADTPAARIESTVPTTDETAGKSSSPLQALSQQQQSPPATPRAQTSSLSHTGGGPTPISEPPKSEASTTISHQSSQASESLPSPATNATEGTSKSIPNSSLRTTASQIWDRKSDGGFPETKELKNRIRNLIDPNRDMGHIDRSLKKSKAETETEIKQENEEELNTPTLAQPQIQRQHEHERNHRSRPRDSSNQAQQPVEENGTGDCAECQSAAAA